MMMSSFHGRLRNKSSDWSQWIPLYTVWFSSIGFVLTEVYFFNVIHLNCLVGYLFIDIVWYIWHSTSLGVVNGTLCISKIAFRYFLYFIFSKKNWVNIFLTLLTLINHPLLLRTWNCCFLLSSFCKELPLRMVDFGVLHWDEAGSTLTKLTSVRRLQQVYFEMIYFAFSSDIFDAVCLNYHSL